MVQYESQSETSTLTVILGLAASKSLTIWFQTVNSAGSPHIMKLSFVCPPVVPLVLPPQAVKSKTATITSENTIFFIPSSFSEKF